MGLKDTPDSNPHLASRRRALFRAIVRLRDPEACERFFIDLCTPAEIAAMADRWAVAQLVDKQMPYRRIQEQTSVSTATITRVARALYHGEGGYRGVLDELKAREEIRCTDWTSRRPPGKARGRRHTSRMSSPSNAAGRDASAAQAAQIISERALSKGSR
jgi:TrpR-related protein YerC/YecD